MSVVFQSLLTLQAPMWLCLVLVAATLFMLWRQYVMARLLAKHARSISNMDAWADATDERLDRIDWMGQRQPTGADHRRSWRKTG